MGSPARDGFGQTDYDMTVGVDPQVAVTANPNRACDGLIYVGFQELWRSSDGGQNFEANALHRRPGALGQSRSVFQPSGQSSGGKPTPIYIGTDGGIAKSVDGGATWKPINGDIGSNLFRGIDIGRGSPANNVYTYGGMQDTGTAGHRPASAHAPPMDPPNGTPASMATAIVVAVDPANPEIVYGFDDWLFIKSTDGGATWARQRRHSPGHRRWIVHAAQPTVGFHRARHRPGQRAPTPPTVWSMSVCSTISTRAPTQERLSAPNGVLNVGPAAQNYLIMVAATTAADANRVWVGVNDGSVHYSADAGATWDQGGFQTQPGGTGIVRGIAIDPVTPDRVAVVYDGNSGIHPKFRTRRVFMTTDSGQTWHDVSGTDGGDPLNNLPDLPMHSAVFDKSASPPALIVASDAGVMRSSNITITGDNVTATWALYGVGLPTVCCNSLAIDNSVNPPMLRVGTYGRSAFEATHATGARLYCSPSLGFGVGTNRRR